MEIQLLQVTASQQKTSAVGGSVVRKTNLHSIARQFMSIGRVDNNVAADSRVGNLNSGDIFKLRKNAYLSDDVLVGKADDQTVLRRIVLVLVLNGQTLASIVVGFSLTTALELGL
jgi:hypothetical protein